MIRTTTNNTLYKIFRFQTFAQAIHRMQTCREDIDILDHHPERTNIYNHVEVKLTTHDANNTITDKDYKLAEILDSHYKLLTDNL